MTATIALPRQPHTDFLSRLRSIGLGLGARGSLGWGLGRSRAGAAAATPWYLAGGAPMPVAAYQPIRAASLAASYSNLANPGTYDAAPGVAPTWASATGWTFDGSTQYLDSTIYPPSDAPATWTIIVQFSGAEKGNVVGTTSMTGAGYGLFPKTPVTGTKAFWQTGEYFDGFWIENAPNMVSGNMALAGITAYRNGSQEGIAFGSSSRAWLSLGIGRRGGNATFGPIYYFSGSIQAIVFYSVPLAAPQVAAVSAAMAAL